MKRIVLYFDSGSPAKRLQILDLSELVTAFFERDLVDDNVKACRRSVMTLSTKAVTVVCVTKSACFGRSEGPHSPLYVAAGFGSSRAKFGAASRTKSAPADPYAFGPFMDPPSPSTS